MIKYTVLFWWGYMEQRAFNEVKMLVQCAQDHCHILLSYAKNAPSIWMVTDGCVGIAGIWRWERLSCNHPNQLHGSGVVLITIHLLLLVSLWLLRDFRCIQSTKVYWGGRRSLYTFYMWLYTTVSRMYLSIEYKMLLMRSYCTYL